MEYDINTTEQIKRSVLGPAWRWNVVQETLATEQPLSWHPDSLIQRTAKYVRDQRSGPEKPAGQSDHDIGAATELWQAANPRR